MKPAPGLVVSDAERSPALFAGDWNAYFVFLELSYRWAKLSPPVIKFDFGPRCLGQADLLHVAVDLLAVNAAGRRDRPHVNSRVD